MGGGGSGAPAGPAELILVGVPVYTADAARRWAGGVAVHGGRVVAVGAELVERRAHGAVGRPRFRRLGVIANAQPFWSVLDLFEPDAGPVGDARVLATLVDGEVVHAAPGWPG
jgi:predicted amidohydrolase YtcJ